MQFYKHASSIGNNPLGIKQLIKPFHSPLLCCTKSHIQVHSHGKVVHQLDTLNKFIHQHSPLVFIYSTLIPTTLNIKYLCLTFDKRLIIYIIYNLGLNFQIY